MPPTGPGGLGARVRIGYGLGSFATGTFGTVPGLLLLSYLTDVLGVAAGLAGLLVFLPKAWDVLLNPWIGSLSDRTTRSRLGPRRSWMLLGALTMPLCFAAPGLDGGPAALYVAVLLLLTASAYACFHVPYVALPAELTADPDERARVMSWRVAFLAVAILLSGALAPPAGRGHRR
ncbi:MFS transporter [Streptomyces sp. NPDC102406]|uniref:MFS transporter n=1 Tax=Streptomyces sp. NPDC102406 TaxID=3366171 RepID=UPI0038134455